MSFCLMFWINDLVSCQLWQMVTRTNKIFVGGLSASTSAEDLKNFFDKYGKVCGRHLLLSSEGTHCVYFFLH